MIIICCLFLAIGIILIGKTIDLLVIGAYDTEDALILLIIAGADIIIALVQLGR